MFSFSSMSVIDSRVRVLDLEHQLYSDSGQHEILVNATELEVFPDMEIV